jgi:tRNA dimethylallyltransferase
MSISQLSPKILVILGPTASGKSELAVRLALRLRSGQAKKKYGISGAEIISADSRQVYRNLDIGTAKVPGKWHRANGKSFFVYKSVRHHLIDFVSPRRQYTSSEYAEAGQKVIRKLFATGHLPIACGGTGHYIAALLGEQTLPNVPPDMKLRAQFDKLTASELFEKLRRLDPRRAKTIDRHNPRRLVRALEIVLKTGRPVPKAGGRWQVAGGTTRYSNVLENIGIAGGEVLKIGLAVSPLELRRRIAARLVGRLKQGMVSEVRKLHAGGLPWKRMEELGLEYRIIAQYLRTSSQLRVMSHESSPVVTRTSLRAILEREIWQYAKRQMTWFRHDKNIRWVESEREALAAVRTFLKT